MSSILNEDSVRLELVLGNGHRLVIPQIKVTLSFHEGPQFAASWQMSPTLKSYYTLDIEKFYNYTVIQGSGSVDTPIYDRMMREKEYYD